MIEDLDTDATCETIVTDEDRSNTQDDGVVICVFACIQCWEGHHAKQKEAYNGSSSM